MTLIGTLMLMVKTKKSSHHLAIAISILCGSETIPRTNISIRHIECGRPAFHEYVSDRNAIAANWREPCQWVWRTSDGQARRTDAERSTDQIKCSTGYAVKTRLHLSPFFCQAKSNRTPAKPSRATSLICKRHNHINYETRLCAFAFKSRNFFAHMTKYRLHYGTHIIVVYLFTYIPSAIIRWGQ